MGSTRLVTDETKAIVTAAAYHPFGETSAEEGSEDYLFTGGKKDATGLYYYGARYYDPDLGRFITRDPLKGTIVSSQSLNRYTYCFNNPLKFVDPLGLGATFSDEEAQKAYEEQTGGVNMVDGRWKMVDTGGDDENPLSVHSHHYSKLRDLMKKKI